MKQHIETLIQNALEKLRQSDTLANVTSVDIQVDMTKDPQFGDFTSNIAMALAKTAKQNPRQLAEKIVAAIPASDYVKKVEVAGPGFINFFLSPEALTQVVKKILSEKDRYGESKIGQGKKILIEFVSSNPTGPLHVGHGRQAAYGSILSNLLDAIGFKTYREYYVNDGGRQVDIVTVSLWLRYQALCGEHIIYPANAYQGDYMIDIARELKEIEGTRFQVSATKVLENLPKDEPEGGDKEVYIDALIARAKDLLGDQYDVILEYAIEKIVDDMREDLLEFGVKYDNWFSERQFVKTKVVDQLLEKLKSSNQVFEKDGALWFRATQFGDTKDRVLVRSNGQKTYFANDVGYHLSKFERGYDIAIDVFGADHHGYIPRMKAALEGSNINPERLVHVLVQFVTLFRGDEQLTMSTRAGTFVTLRELRHEVGNDAARFFYVMRKNDQQIDFDLDLAKSKSNENPVYYVQYAHARICSVFKQLKERNINYDEAKGLQNLQLLTADQERVLLNTLFRYPDIVIKAALQYEPHVLTNYLRELAADFHAYYNSQQFLVEDENLRHARLALIQATRQTLRNGFKLLGISAPESM